MVRAGDDHGDAGFSLVEIVVSMFLLALLAISFLPLVAQAMTSSARSTTSATAARLVSEELELVRGRAGVCPVSPERTVTDPRGVPLRVASTASACTGLVTYHVSVTTATTPAKVLAEAATLISVRAP